MKKSNGKGDYTGADPEAPRGRRELRGWRPSCAQWHVLADPPGPSFRLSAGALGKPLVHVGSGDAKPLQKGDVVRDCLTLACCAPSCPGPRGGCFGAGLLDSALAPPCAGERAPKHEVRAAQERVIWPAGDHTERAQERSWRAALRLPTPPAPPAWAQARSRRACLPLLSEPASLHAGVAGEYSYVPDPYDNAKKAAAAARKRSEAAKARCHAHPLCPAIGIPLSLRRRLTHLQASRRKPPRYAGHGKAVPAVQLHQSGRRHRDAGGRL